MKFKILLTGVLCVLCIATNAQHLEKKVSLSFENKNLEEILEQLRESYNIEFSYLNNELPRKKFTLTYADKPLSEILDELLKDSELGFIEYDDQIIIKRGIKETTPDKKDVKQEEVSQAQEETVQLQEKKDTVKVVNEVVETKPDDTLVAAIDTAAMILAPEKEDKLMVEVEETEPVIRKENLVKKLEYFFETDYDEYIKRPYHFGIFYPISTNGKDAGKYVNNLSLHLLVGFSAGLEGFETSLIGNVERDYVNGFQLGGLFNLVRNNVKGGQASGLVNVSGGENDGIQLAGLANVVAKGSDGLQAAGIANVVGDSSKGLQMAGIANVVDGSFQGFQGAGVTNTVDGDVVGFQASGLVNIARGDVKSGQAAGFLNIANDVYGPQLAGFGNIQNGKSKSFQAAGFINQAEDIKGAQLAGFINIAKRVKGFQGAGFINIAKSMKGVQLGIINISDSLQGVPIGLFTIVRENGYFDLELFYADDFEANALVKFGAQKFHNMFGFSYETLTLEQDITNRWAVGYGFGAQFGKRIFRLNTDVMGYHVFEKNINDKPFNEFELNLLGKFRALGSIHFGNFGIFGGPVLNVMISEHKNSPEAASIGSQLVTDGFYDRTFNNKTNLKMWIGYNIGIRF